MGNQKLPMDQHYEITLLRHGESTGNTQGYIQGQIDFPLSEKGLHQAHSLAKHWQAQNITFDAMVCSPLERARQTGETIAQMLNMKMEFDPEWMEQSFGEWEGHPYEEALQASPPVDFHHPYKPAGKGAESNFELYLRASKALLKLLQRPPGRYLVVSHGAILNMALYAIMGLTPQGNYNSPRFIFENTGYIQLIYQPGKRQWWITGFHNCSNLENNTPEKTQR